MSTHNTIKTLEPKMTAPPSSLPVSTVKPVSPFAMSCRFDRSRGEFVVHAGARAGGLAVVAVALLAVGALGFVGDAIRDASPRATAPTVVAAADAPVVTAAPDAAVQTRRVESVKAKPQAQQSKKAKTQPKQTSRSKTVAAKGAKSGPFAPATASTAQSAQARQPGMNYLVLKSFPSQPEAAAAREALAARGVQATVERNLPGWAGKSWYSLVGTAGFDMDRERGEFNRHVKELKAMKLDPKPYRWRGPAEFASGQ
jgi:cell wall-associated NlpC family hydrolase